MWNCVTMCAVCQSVASQVLLETEVTRRETPCIAEVICCVTGVYSRQPTRVFTLPEDRRGTANDCKGWRTKSDDEIHA
jgi:hypothetical protein